MHRRAFLTGLGALLAAPCVEAQPTSDVSVSFFETVQRAPSRQSETYDELVLPSGTKMYVARAPALVFYGADIVSVVIRRNASSQQYRAIVTLGPDAATQLARFSERNVGKRVDIRVNFERLGTPLIVAPIRSGRITLDTGTNRERIDRLFGPLGAKLSWPPESAPAAKPAR
jgi:preprotein translocase subunit SecD